MKKEELDILQEQLRQKLMAYMQKELPQTKEGKYYKGVPCYTLETSMMTFEHCYVVLYIWDYGDHVLICTTINVENRSFATDEIDSHQLKLSQEEFDNFKNDETAIENYITSITSSAIWQYITSVDYRMNLIRIKTK